MDNIVLYILLLFFILFSACLIIFIYFYIKRLDIIDEILQSSLENVIKRFNEDEEMQKSLYQIGGILGQGVKGGMGISTPKSGRFKWQDLVAELAGQWFQKTMINNPSPPPEPSPQPGSQDILIQKPRDKW